MSILKLSNISLNFCLAYVGIENNWISKDEVLLELDDQELNKINASVIGDLYSFAEENSDNFVNLLKKIISIDSKKYEECKWVWSIAFLNEIRISNRELKNKLKEISKIWTMVGYPSNWRKFIYYLPVGENSNSGEESLYRNFEDFLNMENIKLSNSGYVRSVT